MHLGLRRTQSDPRHDERNGFNFVLDDLASGVHVVEVQAKIDTDTACQNGSASAYATIGKGSMTVEEVRMIKGEDIQLD